MIFRDRILVSAAAALLALGTPAFAQDAAMRVGATVNDTEGGEVGTITRVDGDFVILRTDRHEVRLPVASFTAHNGGYVMAMTRQQVNEAVERELANQGPVATVGAIVRDPAGGEVGTITEADDAHATVRLASDRLVRLPVSAFARGPNGPVIGMTAAELEAAAAEASQ
jgi:preprotein translocase subunit YajC